MPIFLRQHRANYVELARQEWDISTVGSVLSLTDEEGKTSEYQQVTREEAADIMTYPASLVGCFSFLQTKRDCVMQSLFLFCYKDAATASARASSSGSWASVNADLMWITGSRMVMFCMDSSTVRI